MALFVSKFINKVDRKGRVSVPAPFRTALAEQSFPGIIVFPSFADKVIEGCPSSILEDIANSTSAAYAWFSANQNEINSLIFSSSHQLAFDPEGRVALPEELMAHAGITDQAAFVGQGKTFRIWEPKAHAEYLARVSAKAQANPDLFAAALGGAK